MRTLENMGEQELWDLLRHYKKLSHQVTIDAIDEYLEQVREIENEITSRDKKGETNEGMAGDESLHGDRS